MKAKEYAKWFFEEMGDIDPNNMKNDAENEFMVTAMTALLNRFIREFFDDCINKKLAKISSLASAFKALEQKYAALCDNITYEDGVSMLKRDILPSLFEKQYPKLWADISRGQDHVHAKDLRRRRGF